VEDINFYCEKLESLRSQAATLVEAVQILQQLFAREAEQLSRREQVRLLDDLQAEIEQKVDFIKGTETAASYEYSKKKVESSIMNFGAGSLVSLLFHSKESPLSLGARMAKKELAKTATFGLVVIAVGNDVPGDVQVIALSQRARQLGKPDSFVISDLEDKKYLVMTPQRFYAVLNKYKEKLLQGVLILPIPRTEFEADDESVFRT
jgi:hypothetical protein